MDKQNEIEKMAADLDKAKELALGYVGSLNNGFGGWYAKCLVEKGYGELRAALKDFAERVKTAFYHEFDELIPSIMSDKIDDIIDEVCKGIQFCCKEEL